MRIMTLSERLRRIELYAAIGAKEYLTTEEAALYIGHTREYVQRLSSSGEVPKYRNAPAQNSVVYFRKSELDAWMSRCRTASRYEVEREAMKIIRKTKKTTL